jgi:hypothetical protein
MRHLSTNEINELIKSKWNYSLPASEKMELEKAATESQLEYQRLFEDVNE